jgi:hypothetical protein
MCYTSRVVYFLLEWNRVCIQMVFLSVPALIVYMYDLKYLVHFIYFIIHVELYFLKLRVLYIYIYIYIKVKVVPLQARCDPEGSRRFRLQDFHDTRHMKVVRSSASRTGRLYPQECSWYSFSLEGRKEICHWKIQWHQRESIPVPSD